MLASKQLTLTHVSITGEVAKTSSEPPERELPVRRGLIFAIVSIGLFMASMDQTIVATALPALEKDLHTGVNWTGWTISVYALGQVIAMPMAGKISDMYGRKKVFMVSAAVFTLSSLCCGFAPNIAVLLLARFIQALGGGAFMPSATGIVSDHFGDQRDRAVGMFTSIFPIGGIVGPAVGGLFVSYWTWRGIFLINVPLGALAAVAVRYVPAAMAPGRRPGARFDLPGLILLAAGLTGLLLGASQGASAGWTAPATWVPLASGAALTACYAGWAARRDQPALDLSLARQRIPALSMALCALASVVTWAAVFLLPVFVQSVQGRSALVAGLAMAPQGLITGLSTALAPRWLTGFTMRVTVLAGFAVLALATLGLLLITAATPLWLIAAILAGRSVAIGLVITPLLQALVQPLRPDQLGDANTLFNTWQRIAGSFGIGLVAALYATRARTLGPVAALHAAGLVLVMIAAAGALGALVLPAVRGTAAAR